MKRVNEILEKIESPGLSESQKQKLSVELKNLAEYLNTPKDVILKKNKIRF